MGICICICITAIVISLIFAAVYWMEHIRDLNEDAVMDILDTIHEHEKCLDDLRTDLNGLDYDVCILRKVVQEEINHE